jgi:hypothetical protein
MRFTLVYQGPLPASANSSRHKHQAVTSIREQFSRQLATLWDTHIALKALKHEAWGNPGEEEPGWGGPHIANVGVPQGEIAKLFGLQSLIAPIHVAHVPYTPLVRKSLNLACELEILFLRQEDPGALILQGGDIDNRIKTLLDALRMPTADEHEASPPQSEHVYCLLESDTLVASLDVDTDRLLFPATDRPNEVFLVVGVSVRVLKVDKTNVYLL